MQLRLRSRPPRRRRSGATRGRGRRPPTRSRGPRGPPRGRVRTPGRSSPCRRRSASSSRARSSRYRSRRSRSVRRARAGCSITRMTPSASSINTLSVISKQMFDGDTPVRRTTSATCSARSGPSWRAERLIDTVKSDCSSCHLAACAAACSSTHAPRGTTRPVSSAKRYELGRRDESALGMLPAHERFGADAPRIVESHDRLEVQPQLVALDRAVQRVPGRVASERASADRVVEELDAARSGVLRVVHRGVGVPEQLVGSLGTGRRQRDADADTHVGFGAAHHERLRERVEQAPADFEGSCPREVVREVLAQDRELVAAEARRQCHPAAASQPRGAPLRSAARRRRCDRGCR